MKMLSIIIPVYNASQFVEKAIGTLIEFITDDVEIIVVNDGSTDNSVELINSCFGHYVASNQIKIFNQNNQGVSVARNSGIKFSEGEYITFVDADDFVFPGYIEEILSAINHFKPDVVEFGCRQFESENDINSFPDIFTYDKFGFMEVKSVIKDIFAKGIFYPPLRVIKRKFVIDALFPVGVKFCEDVVFFSEVYKELRTTVHIPLVLYAYRINPGGATRNIRPEYITAMYGFYGGINKSDGVHADLLKLNVFFILYKLHELSNTQFIIPKHIEDERFSLFMSNLFEMKVSLRKKMIVLAPRLYFKLRTFIKG